MFLLQFLFVIFIVFLVLGLFVVLRIYMTVRRTARKFSNFATGGGTSKDSGNKGRYGNKKTHPNIIDNRSEEIRKRKIFPSNVGDFVKFKEVK